MTGETDAKNVIPGACFVILILMERLILLSLFVEPFDVTQIQSGGFSEGIRPLVTHSDSLALKRTWPRALSNRIRRPQVKQIPAVFQAEIID